MGNNMINVFMGQYDIVLKEILNDFKIDLVIVEDKSSNRKVINICVKYGIPYRIIQGYVDIMDCLGHRVLIDLCFVASFGIILKKDFITRCKHIVNFHPGDVEVCRGKHPLPVAILNRHKLMGIAAHLIDSEKIDAGPVIAKMIIPIEYDKSYRYNEGRLLEALRFVVRYVVEGYVKNGKFASYEWDENSSGYYNPMQTEILNRIINANDLREIAGQ